MTQLYLFILSQLWPSERTASKANRNLQTVKDLVGYNHLRTRANTTDMHQLLTKFIVSNQGQITRSRKELRRTEEVAAHQTPPYLSGEATYSIALDL